MFLCLFDSQFLNTFNGEKHDLYRGLNGGIGPLLLTIDYVVFN